MLSNLSERAKFQIAVAAILISGLIAAGAMVFMGRGDDERPKSTVELSVEDQRAAEVASKAFVQTAGTWGVKQGSITPNNFIEARYLIRSMSAGASQYWIDRSVSYKAVLGGSLSSAGPLVYDRNTYTHWDDQAAREYLSSFTIQNVSAKSGTTGGYVEIGAQRFPSAYVKTTFTSRQTNMRHTVDDASWDGTVDIMARNYNQDVTVTLVKQDEKWRVYDVANLTQPFLLTTWREPDASYEVSMQVGFTKVDSLKANLKAVQQ